LRVVQTVAISLAVLLCGCIVFFSPSVANACTEAQKLLTGTCPEISGGFSGQAAQVEAQGGYGQPGGGGTGTPSPPRQRPENVSLMTPQERIAYLAEQRALAEAEGRVWRDPFWFTGVPGAPTAPITLDDIASFRPVTGGSGMEPNGWMVTGLDTNFYSAASVHVVDGMLLGTPAAVRFTPRSWLFDYGDGASARTSTGGASWAALGLAEFDPTATSHVYAASGTFTIDIAVEYGAEYSLDGQTWTAIAGTLTVPAARFTATAGGAKTVLVARDCLANPRGPGC